MGTKYKGTPEEILALNTYIKLMRAADTVEATTNQHLANYNLTISQFGVLEALYHMGTLSQVELAQKILKSTGNITTILKNLEKRYLITRTRDPDDNRYMQVCITDEGKSMLKVIFPLHVTGIVSMIGVLSNEEQQLLGDLCRKLGLTLLHKE